MGEFTPHSDLAVTRGQWLGVRVDGRAFHTYTETAGLRRPFDYRLHHAMRRVAEALLVEFDGHLAYTHSDECSLILHPEYDQFNRRVEKLVSLSASVATLTFERHSPGPDVAAHFDSRVLVLGPTWDGVESYLRYRRADSRRNFSFGRVYFAALAKGKSPEQARRLASDGVNREATYEWLTGDRLAHCPVWERDGSYVTWVEYPHTGRNPLTGEEVPTTRRRPRTCEGTPV